MISWFMPFMISGLITVPDSPHVLWNNIVDWTTEVVRYNSMQKGLLFIKYCDGYLIPRISGIVDGQYVVFDGERIAMTKEDVETLSEAGIITKPELEALLRGEEFSTVINPK